MTRHCVAIGPTLALLVLGGCVSFQRSPQARLLVLEPTITRSLEARPLAASADLLGVLTPSVPGYLDRPQLVVHQTTNQVKVSETDRWAEPLPLGIARTLAEDLGVLLPGTRVVVQPWNPSASVRLRLSIEVFQFSRQASGEVLVAVRWALLPARGEAPLATQATEVRKRPTGSDAAAEVAALSQALGDLAREIAEAVKTTAPPSPAASQ
jgi:uncharacterized lipoprotein YmbA